MKTGILRGLASVGGGHGVGGKAGGSPRQMNKNGRRGDFSLGNMSRYKKYLFPVETSEAGGGCGVTQQKMDFDGPVESSFSEPWMPGF